MITWNSQKPDFCRRPIEELAEQLPFNVACSVLLVPAQAPKVVIKRTVAEGILQHLRERSVEMSGLLIGSVHDNGADENSFAISISDSVGSIEYDSTGVSLRMDTDVWERARLKSREGCSVIGWYHSHPNLGAFFSGTDRRTQRAFFHHPHSIGLVIDPVRGEEKWFIGPESQELGANRVWCHS